MSKLLAIAGLLGITLIPLHAQSAEAAKRSCWLRDSVSPTPTTIYAVCQQGTLWFSRDSGAKWDSVETGATASIRAMAFLDASRGYLIGKSGMILATEDAGKTWVARNSKTTENLMGVAFVGEQGWIAAYAGKILHTADGGKTWSEQTSGTKQTLETIYFQDAQHGWAAGWAGTVLRTTDGGATWQIMKADKATWSVSSIYFRDLQNGWLVGFGGQILRSKDGGTSWDLQDSPVKNSVLSSVAFENANRAWITLDEGFLVSEDGGDTWKAVKTPVRYFMNKTVKVGNDLWALGQSGMLRRVGTEWKKVDSLVVDKTINFTSQPAVPTGPAPAPK
jgi:photosystem II stability/assembly factor-like uncharacterized protein